MSKFIAVVEDIIDEVVVLNLEQGMISIPLELLPDGVHAGLVLEITIDVSESKTDERQNAVRSLQKRLQNQ